MSSIFLVSTLTPPKKLFSNENKGHQRDQVHIMYMYVYIYICMVHAPINPIWMFFSLLLFVFLGVSAIGGGYHI